MKEALADPGGAPAGVCAVVWIDARSAFIVTWRAGRTHLVQVASDVPAHHRSTGHVRRVTAGAGGAGPPRSAGEGPRLEHLRRYIDAVAGRLAAAERVEVLGPRQDIERLVTRLHELDHDRAQPRQVGARPARRLTRPQLVAHVRQLAGDVPRRRTVGACRRTGAAVAGTQVRPRRAAFKPRHRHHLDDEASLEATWPASAQRG
jgi:hypothetical protein